MKVFKAVHALKPYGG